MKGQALPLPCWLFRERRSFQASKAVPCISPHSCWNPLGPARFGWFAATSCRSKHDSFLLLCLCLEEILQTENSLANSFQGASLAREHLQYSACIPGHSKDYKEQGMAASVALCVTRSKLQISLTHKEKEAQQKPEKGSLPSAWQVSCCIHFQIFKLSTSGCQLEAGRVNPPTQAPW